MRKWLILLSALTVTTANGVPAWTWVDADGQVHFSDRPAPGAKQVELTGAQGFGRAARQTASRAQSAEQASAAGPPYRSLQIVSPRQQESLWNIGGTLNVQLGLEPALLPGHRLLLVLDGARLDQPVTGAQTTVPNVFRGAHTLVALVLDSAGAEIQRSGTTTFIVQQTSSQNPNSLTAPRPPLPLPRRN